MTVKGKDPLQFIIDQAARLLAPIALGFGGAVTGVTSGNEIANLFYHEGWYEEYRGWLLIPLSVAVVCMICFISTRLLIVGAISTVAVAVAFAAIRQYADPVSEWRIVGFVLFNTFFAQLFGLAVAVGLWRWLRAHSLASAQVSNRRGRGQRPSTSG